MIACVHSWLEHVVFRYLTGYLIAYTLQTHKRIFDYSNDLSVLNDALVLKRAESVTIHLMSVL